MEDLFSDLSSISDCDDECLLNVSSKNAKCFFIQTTLSEVVFQMPPAYELEEPDVKSMKQRTLEEKNCETDSKGEEKCDKWVQTDFIEMQSEECFADLPPTFREATYTESALERVLRHISAHLHRTQLQQWLAEQPQRNASFHIKPVQTRTIYKAVYNQERVLVVAVHLSNSKLSDYISKKTLTYIIADPCDIHSEQSPCGEANMKEEVNEEEGNENVPKGQSQTSHCMFVWNKK